MCGIIAFWDSSGTKGMPVDEAILNLKHRGPDADSFCWKEGRRLCLAHTRLKIIDRSDEANQPFTSPCGRWSIVYNGEIYNFREIREEIGQRWHWRTSSDTEVLVAAWALWGSACLSKLVGMFAFVMHDGLSKTLTVVRDRFGIKPLYQARSGTQTIFCSEIPPLFRFIKPQANLSTIRTYLELGKYDHTEQTFFDGIESVPPGTLVQLDLVNDEITTKRWYNVFEYIPDLGSYEKPELLEELERLICQSVEAHLIADVPVGLNVSGGVDSSMLIRKSLSSITDIQMFNQDYDGYSELPWLEKMAPGSDLHVSRLDANNILRLFDRTLRSQAEPFGGTMVCGYNALYKTAKEKGVSVLLDGNGVDEIFLGYERYCKMYAMQPINDVRNRGKGRACGSPLSINEANLGASIDGSQGLMPNSISRQLKKHSLLINSNVEYGNFDLVRSASIDDLLHSKIPRGLRFNDRVSMNHSCELRVPFLDHRLVEFGLGVPTEFLLNQNIGKLLFRDVLAKYGQRSVAYAPKRSVQSAQREWLAEDWRPLVNSVIQSERFADRGWIDSSSAQRAYSEYVAGDRSNSFFIWQWLNLELWARMFLDGEESPTESILCVA